MSTILLLNPFPFFLFFFFFLVVFCERRLSLRLRALLSMLRDSSWSLPDASLVGLFLRNPVDLLRMHSRHFPASPFSRHCALLQFNLSDPLGAESPPSRLLSRHDKKLSIFQTFSLVPFTAGSSTLSQNHFRQCLFRPPLSLISDSLYLSFLRSDLLVQSSTPHQAPPLSIETNGLLNDQTSSITLSRLPLRARCLYPFPPFHCNFF